MAEAFRDRSAMRVIAFASFVIIFSIILVGAVVYQITKNEAVKKLKDQDLVFIADSIASKIDGTIARAKETSLLLAHDPEIIRWIEGGEQDALLTEHAREKLISLRRDFGYSNSFIVSAVTNDYWSEKGDIIATLSDENPNDRWFYGTMASHIPVSLNLDYNEARGNTFVFINALIGNPVRPSGIAGVGFTLTHLAEDFERIKYGENSSIWLIDGSGKIYLTNRVDHYGVDIGIAVPEEVRSEILNSLSGKVNGDPYVLEYYGEEEELYDLISYSVKSTDWRLVFQIRRSETISFLDTIKMNTIIAALISIIAITFLFFFISRYIANPYKRALLLNRELEEKVEERTRELSEEKQKLVDSIEYAQKIQESLLTSEDELHRTLEDCFLLWKPRDVVGGDFYWIKRTGDGYFVAVGDCTGHGVPGALMATITLSILNQIIGDEEEIDPAAILGRLSLLVRQMLRRDGKNAADDGLDIGIFRYRQGMPSLFAGAKTDLYIYSGEAARIIRGDRRSIGYRNTDESFIFTNQEINTQEGNVLYLSTDGFIDQNGGMKNYSFGKTRFMELIRGNGNRPLPEQQRLFEETLRKYMGEEPQRDDIAVLALRIAQTHAPFNS